MLTFEQPLLLLLLIPIGFLVYLTWRRMSLPYGAFQRGLILACRITLFAFIILALSGAAWTQPLTRQSTVFVGDISASTNTQRTFIEQWIGAAIQHKRPDDNVGIVATGRNALVEQAVTSLPAFSHFESTPDTNYTDLAAGLRLAAAILPTDSLRHIVLLTDGQQNLEDALQEAQILQQQGIRLDIVPLPGSTNTADARIDGLTAPSQLHTNEHFALHLKVSSSVAQKVTVRIYLDASLLTQQTVDLSVGQQDLSYDMQAPPPGFHTFHVTLEAPYDAIAQNDEASAFVNVQGAPHVLVIEGQAGSGHNIASALQATGMQVTVGTPSDVPVTLGDLAPYSSVVLADVPAAALGDIRMQMLQTFVRDLGRGLVVSGGQNSYGVGGYANTPLEQTLPVSMAIPQHKDTPDVAVVLIVESLEAQIPINISKEAAKEVVGLLTPRDQVGISAAYGTLSIKMQHVTNKTAIDKAIDNLNPADPPSYLPDLVNAEQELQHTNAKIKHVILLGDGDAFDSYAAQAQKMAGENITISTVATNSNSSAELGTMQQIAQWGKGRFYNANNTSAIPQILLQETQRAARRSIINETFNPAVVGNNPILSGINGLPSLDGYVATTPKPAAQIVLISHLDDPVLATWQYGLGRVVAWTSDALGLWTKNWLTWNDAPRWWANLVTWATPANDNSALTLNGSVVSGSGHLSVDLTPGSTPTSDQQQVQIHVIAPDLSQQTVTLQPTAPNHWEGNFPTTQVGAYLLQATWQGLSSGKASKLSTTTGMVVPYSPEYLTQGTDTRFLTLLAQAGGGKLLDTNPNNAASAFTQNLIPVSSSVPIVFLLLILAALLLPIDIAARRLAGLDFFKSSYQWMVTHLRPGTTSLAATANSSASESVTIAPLSQLRAQRKERNNQLAGVKPTIRKEHSPPPATAPVEEITAPTAPASSSQTTENSMASRLIEAKRKREQTKR